MPCLDVWNIVQFFVVQQRIAKKMHQAVPAWIPSAPSQFLTKRRRRKYRIYKALPWVKYDDPRLLLSIIKTIEHYSQRIQFFFSGICSRWLYDFSVLSKKQAFANDGAKNIFKIQVNVHSCKNANSPTRLVCARRALSLFCTSFSVRILRKHNAGGIKGVPRGNVLARFFRHFL